MWELSALDMLAWAAFAALIVAAGVYRCRCDPQAIAEESNDLERADERREGN